MLRLHNNQWLGFDGLMAETIWTACVVSTIVRCHTAQCPPFVRPPHCLLFCTGVLSSLEACDLCGCRHPITIVLSHTTPLCVLLWVSAASCRAKTPPTGLTTAEQGYSLCQGSAVGVKRVADLLISRSPMLPGILTQGLGLGSVSDAYGMVFAVGAQRLGCN